MADVAHSTLTGADLHEPKGIGSAAAGTVYTATGSGSGNWTSVSTSLNFTGMIADFAVPIAPLGWLECDGSTVSRTTYASLFDAVTIQQTGTRTSTSAVITGLSSTTHIKVGYFVSGAGISTGTSVLSVDTASQITLSAAATSSGTSTVVVGPWALGDGSTTFSLPACTTDGKYRRSRSSTYSIGVSQTDQNKSHTHTGTTNDGGGHTHTGSTGANVGDHTHLFTASATTTSIPVGTGSFVNVGAVPSINNPTGTQGSPHYHSFTTDNAAAHTHTFTSGAGSADGTESRPLSIVIMTCIKT